VSIKEFSEIATAKSMQLIARVMAAGRVRTVATGIEYIPASGPALLVSRHYHHLYDGLAFFAALTRPFHILVALDWTPNVYERRAMEWLTGIARWPVVLRPEALMNSPDDGQLQAQPMFSVADIDRYRRRALRESIELLVSGQLLVVFPEGHPNIDPHRAARKPPKELLPFKAGFAAIAAAAEKRLHARLPIIPAGLHYTKSQPCIAELNFGATVWLKDFPCRSLLVRDLEERIANLSGLPAWK